MKKNGYIVRKIKLINNEHIKLALELKRKLQLNKVYFVIQDDIHLFNMLKIALNPYRKLYVCDNINENDVDISKYFDCVKIIQSEQLNEIANFDNVNKHVRKYIMDNALFDDIIIKNNVKEKRYLHCLSVASLAKSFAVTNNYDPLKAYQAGLLHDVAKGMDALDLKLYMNFNSNEFENNQDLPVIHQYVGAKYLKRRYKLENKEVLNAIKHHCLGDYSSKLAKMIFCADKLDPLRGYDSSFLINECLKDINIGFNLVAKQNDDYLKEKGVIL